MYDEEVERIRRLSKCVIERACPGELGVFDAVWAACEGWVRSSVGRGAAAWSFAEYECAIAEALGAVGGMDALDLVSAKAVAAITATVSVLGSLPRPTEQDAVRLVREYARVCRIGDPEVIHAMGVIVRADVGSLEQGLPVGGEGSGAGTYRLYGDDKKGKEIDAAERERIWRSRHSYRLVADVERTQVFFRGEELRLKPQVFVAVAALLRSVGRVCHFERIASDVWGHRWEHKDPTGATMRKKVRKLVDQFLHEVRLKEDLRPWLPELRRWAPGYIVYGRANNEPDGEPLNYRLIDRD